MQTSFREIKKQIKSSEKIILNDSSILSYGSNRVCYLDESNPSKIIKVARHPESWKKDHRQSFSEWYVSKSIASTNSDCLISQCQSWVRTNKGPGLVVERIVDDHGQSITLRKLLFRRELNVERALLLVEKIIYNFSVNGVPASDFNIDNFVIEGEHANNKLVMIDGFSPKKINLKTWLLLHSKILSNRYTKRKWRQTKTRFTYCAQKVYAGDYNFAAAMPLSGASKGSPSIKPSCSNIN
ncbi:YrbL family protein [Vreelandella neptunia]|uniref:PhoP regulatory network YrbL family protein n=1 Tax=Vreelandella neptunia TaxID=115551 RepID=A0ABS9S566_9GAMM|nr:YrbL family protein [Halomonas neptunia]MCH4811235.1 PhoP regulatory network YrbL family protein [Halomonas neptunia]